MPKKLQSKKKPVRNNAEYQEAGEIDETTEDFHHEGKKYNNRKIQSNWEKYEVDTNDDFEEEDKTAANDFKSLVNSTHTFSNAFKFKFERNWEKELEEQQPFQLNINLEALSAGLSCIPFYKRLGLDPSEFSEEDLQKCDVHAEKCWKKYEMTKETYFKVNENEDNFNRICKKSERTKNYESQKQGINISLSEKENNDFESNLNKLRINTESISKSDEVSEISDNFRDISLDSELLHNPNSDNASKQKKVNNDEDLEDWLDSVLDG